MSRDCTRIQGVRLPVLAVLVLLLSVSAVATAAGEGIELDAVWLLADGGERPFDPSRLSRVPRPHDGSADAVARIVPRDGRWPDGVAILALPRPALEIVQWRQPGQPFSTAAGLWRVRDGGFSGHDRIGFRITHWPPDGVPIELRFAAQQAIAGTVTIAIQDVDEFARADAAWLALASACFAVMLTMALMAVFFAWKLRESVFLIYAGYMLSYAGIQIIQTGFVSAPLDWHWLAADARSWGRVAITVSGVLALLFLDRFASLAAFFRVGRLLVLVPAGLIALVGLAGLLPMAGLRSLPTILINPLLLASGPIMLLVATVAWLRGSRYAGFFLVGWTPLLLLTVIGSAQMYGFAPDWVGSDDATLLAATFEALVLSLGLADKTVALRVERDHARTLADTDPLTQVLNRRGLVEGLERAIVAARRRSEPMALLFLDLDHFKSLNDRRGHAAGDQALRQVADLFMSEIRGRDLLGRLGGEEFVVVLPRCPRGRALHIAERLRSGVADVRIADGEPGGSLTVSIGVAFLKSDDDAGTLIDRADRAMYRAKQFGRNRVVAIDDEDADTHRDNGG